MTDSINNSIIGVIKNSIQAIFSQYFSHAPKINSDPLDLSKEKTLISSMDFQGTLTGTLGLRISSVNAQKVVSKMLGSDIQEDSPSIYDGTGEIANMIAGSVKNYLVENGHDIFLSTPTTVTGHSIQCRVFKNSEKTLLNFVSEEIKFIILFIYDKSQIIK